MKNLIFPLVLSLACSTASSQSSREKLLKGYLRHSRGLTMEYHSMQDDATRALLVRCREGLRTMVWETETVPHDHRGDLVRFIWIAAIDVHTPGRRFDVFLNGDRTFTITAPAESVVRSWSMKGDGGAALDFKGTLIDRHGDLFGYMFLTVPAKRFTPGRAVEIKVVAEDAGTNNWFMIFRYGVEGKVNVRPENAVFLDGGRRFQCLRVTLLHYGDPVDAVIRAGDSQAGVKLAFGASTVRVRIPVVRRKTAIPVQVTSGEAVLAERTVEVAPVKPYVVNLVHHSHVDIGYTHVQSEVEKIQWGHLEKAIELARKTRHYPEGARFRWNVEVMWAVDSYFRRGTTAQKRALRTAIREGWIELGALFGDQLTGLARGAELFETTGSAQRIAAACGVPPEVAMLTDVPGCTWGMVPVLAQSGVKFFSMGTNRSHRIGSILERWGDRPFYWVSPSGEEKVLCWVHGKGYSLFHTGLNFEKIMGKLAPETVFNYLDELNEMGYPYDMVILRYSIGSDNGPCDPGLPDAVKAWNEKYVTPRIAISTVADAFRAFEEKYGDRLPVVRGDLTPYWEDGAASSARETALSRAAAERLTQAEILWTLLDPAAFPRGRFEAAWRQVLLYTEHTWGAWNSISEPESEFAKQQWAVKQSYAHKADTASRALVEAVVGKAPERPVDRLDVYNTASWPRSGVVLIPEHFRVRGGLVHDAGGKPLPSQRLSTGDVAVKVEGVPALGAARIFFKEGDAHVAGDAFARGNRTGNRLVEVDIDPGSGAIRSLHHRGASRNLVDVRTFKGLNDFVYVAGRSPDARQSLRGPVKISVTEKGPLVAEVVVESGAPGCEKLIRKVRVAAGSERVGITNEVHKRRVLDPEGVHFAFPFAVPSGQVRIDVAFGRYRPEADQLDGSCKNYFTAQRWVDVSNKDFGVTLAVPDTPLVEIGRITCDPIACGWVDRVAPSQTLFSYVMNNYWETNYCAAQAGRHEFRYALLPHGRFHDAQAERFGIEQSQPLLVAPARGDRVPHAPVRFEEGSSLVVTRMRPGRKRGEILVTLFNASAGPEVLELKSGGGWMSDPAGKRGIELRADAVVPGWGVRHVLVKRRE